MKPLCRQCGQPFSPTKRHPVVCFDCYIKQIRENFSARVKVLEKFARIVTKLPKATGNPASK